MHGHVSANVLRQQGAGVADSQGGLADPSEAAGETRC